MMRRNPQLRPNNKNRQWRLPNIRPFGNTQFKAPPNPNRPYIQLSTRVQGKTHALTFLVDTGSQITIISYVPPKPMGINIDIQGVNGMTRAPRKTIEILLYDKHPIPVLAAFMPGPMDILGMDVIPFCFHYGYLINDLRISKQQE
jgi:hypothetical protein